MKRIILSIPDSKLSFFTELLTHFTFIKLVNTKDAQKHDPDELDEWNNIAMKEFDSAFGETEPDYNHMQLQEPNSRYGSEAG